MLLKKELASDILVYLIIGLYSFFIVFSPLFFIHGFDIPRELALGTNDWLQGGINNQNGRFFPLAAQQYNFFRLFTENIFICYVYRGVIFIISMFFFRRILIESSKSVFLSNIIILVLIFIPGFSNVWFSLSTAEGEVFFLLSILFYLYQIHYRKMTNNYIIFIIIFIGNLVLYYKEPLFILIGAFAVSQLILSKTDKRIDKKLNMIHLFFIFSSILFLAAYMYFVYFDFNTAGVQRYGVSNEKYLLIKNLVNFSFNDSIIVIVSVPLMLYRIWLITYKNEKPSSLYDSMLFSGNMYFFAYILLNMYNLNYLLPAYVVVLPPLAYFIFYKNYIKVKVVNFLLIFNVIVFITNTFPLSLHMISNYRYSDYNFNEVTKFLSNYIILSDKKIDIFFEGIERKNVSLSFEQKHDRGIIMNIGEKLISEGVPLNKFDFKSNIEIKDRNSFLIKYNNYPYTIFSNKESYPIKKANLLLITPHSKNLINQEYFLKLEKDYNLLYKTTSLFSLPNYSLKNIIKYMLLYGDLFMNNIQNKNIFKTQDYYIYIKK